MNITVLRGRLSRPPELRELPSGDVLVAYEVTVPAEEGQRAESVPVVWPGAPAAALEHETDLEVLVVGRTRRRFFRAGGSTQSRTEVVAEQVVPARQAKRADKALGAVLQRLRDGAA